MLRTRALWISMVALSLIAAAPWSAGALAKEADAATASVQKGFYGRTIGGDGSFEPVTSQTVSYRPESYHGTLEVLEAAPAGPVVEGQVLVRFRTDWVDRQIEAQTVEVALARNKLATLDASLARKKLDATIAREEATRSRTLAEQALERFQTVERKLRLDEAEHGMQSWRNRIKDQTEELEQLEKMYKADDLTEETEEIVLKRAKRGLERSLRSFGFREIRHRWFLEQRLPQDHDSLKIRAQKARANEAYVLKTADLGVAKSELERKKGARSLEAAERKLRELKSDRAALSVRAPMAGHAVPGRLKGGKWDKVKPLDAGTHVKARQVLYTVFNPKQLRFRANVSQQHLRQIQTDQVAAIVTNAFPNRRLQARVEDEAFYGAGGKYRVLFRLEAQDPDLRAGFVGKAMIVSPRDRDKLSLPASCFEMDKDSKQAATVWVVTEEGTRAVKVKVAAHKRFGRRWVMEGLEDGQQVLLHPPEDEKSKD